MTTARKWVAGIFLIAITLACSLSGKQTSTPIVFPTPKNLFPSRTPGPSPTYDPKAAGSSTPFLAHTPTPTHLNWPPPYWGSPGPTQITPIPTPAMPVQQSDSITFLFIGSDKFTSSFRTDSLILANFQPDHKLFTLMSIPRDLYVYIPGWRMQRINAAYYHGELGYYPGKGPALIKDTILYNFGIKVDHIAMVDFDGFTQVIDTLGGIDVPVACQYTDWKVKDPEEDLQDEDNWYLHTVKPGVVHMNGEYALWYARSRMKSTDYDRSRRQQEVIRAIYKKALALKMITRIPQLWEDFNEMVFTDAKLTDIIPLSVHAFDLPSASIRSFYMSPAEAPAWISPEGAYYMLPQPGPLQELIHKAFSPPGAEEAANPAYVVEVWNGTPHSYWADLAAERLSYGGFDSQVNPADKRNFKTSILYDFTFEQDSGRIDTLLALLGLNRSNLFSDPNPESVFPYRLILGEDYDPCFNPNKIDR